VPEASAGHGAITMRDLLTMTSGLRWNGLRDYNIFTMPDRVRDALTLDIVHPRGTYYEYAQSAVSLLAEAVERAAGEDFERFAERELAGRLGIPDDRWHWVRDRAGNVAGFMGVNMRPDDFGRLGELMRRGGVWRGERLLSERFAREAVTPSATNGCYGWLIWLNRGSPCVGVTITDRPVDGDREYPDLPVDMYRFSGLFGQLVTVFPSQDIVVVRTGQDRGLLPAGGSRWEHELYRQVLGAITDGAITPAGEAKTEAGPNADYGFQTALREPDQYAKAVVQDPLPPAGPRRARAVVLDPDAPRAGRTGAVRVRLRCPVRASGPCAGTATLAGARRPARFSVAPGAAAVARFTLTRRALAALRRTKRATLRARAVTDDAAGGVLAELGVALAAPKPAGQRSRSRPRRG
jgi:CubicO group peptidase (beta-lactamase class C family)